jgi:hypothetical protein
MSETPTICEMRVASLAQIEGVRYVIINPAQGIVVTIADEPSIKFLRPSAPVSHWGEANYGSHITWKPFSAIGSSTNPAGA